MEENTTPQKAHEFFTYVALRGSFEIREFLNVNYTNISPQAQDSYGTDPRKRYLHGILQEVVKAGLRHQVESNFFLDNYKEELKSQDLLDEHIAYMILQERIDGISLYCRKLSEILIDLIGFSQSNTQEQYQHFLVVCELDRKLSIQKNFSDYYSCDNKLITSQIDVLKKQLSILSSKISNSSCWYLEKGSDFRKASVNKRLLKVLPYTESFQRLPLRDYNEAFSKTSASLHPNPLPDESAVNPKLLEMSLTRLGILFMHVIFAIGNVLESRPSGGVMERVTKLLKDNKYPEEQMKRVMVNPKVRINDAVLVLGRFLAKVTSEKESSFGYKTFSIKFLENEIEDEFIAADLFSLGPYEQFIERVGDRLIQL